MRKIAALRMQLNPHFLFNTMNSISSLMRSDIDAADSHAGTTEQLASYDLGAQETFSSSRCTKRSNSLRLTWPCRTCDISGRVTRTLFVDPELHDALVPAMILQPIVENAYAHGLSKLDRGGTLSIEVCKDGNRVRAGDHKQRRGFESRRRMFTADGHGVGLANVKNRLRLHYGEECAFSISEVDPTHVEVSIAFPLQLSASCLESVTRFGV